MAPDIAGEAPSNLPTFSSAPIIDSFAPLVPTFIGSFVLSFVVSVFEPAPRTSSEFLVRAGPYTPHHIYPENSYIYYLAYPALELYIEFNTETTYRDAGRKR
ncbi:hypothetical protein N7490_006806 [Penicillium lividum]|nr:hypothetical protein N7490_006806 [Penicillium lividum]